MPFSQTLNARPRIFLLRHRRTDTNATSSCLFKKSAPGCTSSSACENRFQPPAIPLCHMPRKVLSPLQAFLHIYLTEYAKSIHLSTIFRHTCKTPLFSHHPPLFAFVSDLSISVPPQISLCLCNFSFYQWLSPHHHRYNM